MSDQTPALASFPPGFRACVFGASGGIGAAFVAHLAAQPHIGHVFAGARSSLPAAGGKVSTFAFDLENEASIAAAAAQVSAEGPLHLVLVATGLLHQAGVISPEKTWRALTPEAFAKAFAINTTGPALIAKHFLGLLAKNEKAVFAAISARVSSVSDNRLGGWHAYRASKAALNMLLRNFAIENAARNRTASIIGLHPGTVDTALSKPFQGQVRDGGLFTAETSAAHLLKVVDGVTPAQSGQLLAWDGSVIPF
jgi:NAD(P)-dependent dehydrogenase (short-subunit alcohol dehydrogenase family)